MYQVEDEPIETIHLYVVREGEKRPPLIPVIVSIFALSILIAISALTSYKQPEQRASIRVLAVPSFTRTFSAAVKVIPTGVRTYPATFAHGVLSILNGSVISQTLPASFLVTATDGTQVVTEAAVFVPAGSANGYGVARVAAHVVVTGINLPKLAVDQVIGTSLYVRNLSAFTGGHPAYSVWFATVQDRLRAVVQARALVASQVIGLHYPCRETTSTTLIWHCQYVSYSVPSYMHVLNVQLQGNDVVVTVWFIAYPRRVWAK